MIRVSLIDDEEHALDMLEIMLNQIGNLEIVGKYSNPVHALEELREVPVDAVFLDIDMPGMRGMEVARELQSIMPDIQIIFTTAYAEFAIEAFAIRSLDYLLKPIKTERLRDSVNRITEAVARRAPNENHQANVLCMGDFSVYLHASKSEPLQWRTNKEKELCAFLVHHRGEVVHQAVILEALWPHSDVGKAKTYLHTCISLLRRNFRNAGLSAKITKVGSGYTLDLGTLGCDVDELEDLLSAILEKEVVHAEALERLSSLYKTDYLGTCDYSWALSRRQQLARRYVSALRRLYHYFQKNGQSVQARECLQRILAISPESEQDGRELIRILIQQGERSEALSIFRQLEKAVRDHLDLELEEKTVQLYRQIIASDARSGL